MEWLYQDGKSTSHISRTVALLQMQFRSRHRYPYSELQDIDLGLPNLKWWYILWFHLRFKYISEKMFEMFLNYINNFL